MATRPTYPAAAYVLAVAKRLLPADSTNLVDVYDNSGGSIARKIDALVVTTNNTADRIITFYMLVSGTAYRTGSITVPDLSGSNGVTDPRINALTTLGTAGPDGVPCVWVPAGAKLQCGLDSALAADKVLDVVGRAVDFS